MLSNLSYPCNSLQWVSLPSFQLLRSREIAGIKIRCWLCEASLPCRSSCQRKAQAHRTTCRFFSCLQLNKVLNKSMPCTLVCDCACGYVRVGMCVWVCACCVYEFLYLCGCVCVSSLRNKLRAKLCMVVTKRSKAIPPHFGWRCKNCVLHLHILKYIVFMVGVNI